MESDASEARHAFPFTCSTPRKRGTMAVDEQAWHEAWDALAEVVGAEAAATLMGAWPRDVARRSDIEVLDFKVDGAVVRLDAKIDGLEKRLDAKIDGLEERLDAKIDGLEERLDAKIDGLQGFLVERIQRSEEHLVAVMRGELNSQVRNLMFGFVGLQGVIGTFVVALLRFAV